MSEVYYLISKTDLDNIGNAIRAKNGLTTKYTTAQMPTAIQAIERPSDQYVSSALRNAFAQRGIFIPENTLLADLPARVASELNWVVGDGNSYFKYEVPQNAPSIDTIHYLSTLNGTVYWGTSLLSYDRSYTHDGVIYGSDNYDMSSYRGKDVYLKFTGNLEVGIYGGSSYAFPGYSPTADSQYQNRWPNSAQLVRAEFGDNCSGHTNAMHDAIALREVYFSSNCKWGSMTNGFKGCISLKKIYINNPSMWTSIGNSEFEECQSLTDFIMPSTTTSIGTYAFCNCKSLTEINLSNITTLGTYAFSGCTSLKSITFPSNITRIPDGIIYNCKSITTVTIPSSVTTIGKYAFAGSGLTSLTIPNGVTTLDNYSLQNTYSLTSLSLPSSIITIGNNVLYALQNTMSNITALTLPQNLQTMGTYNVYGFSKLTSLEIPATLTAISNYCFVRLTSVTTLTIPESVASIGKNCFTYNTGMTEYHFLRTTPPTLDTGCFTNIPSGCVIYVPQGSLSAYQSATNWSAFASYMQEEA